MNQYWDKRFEAEGRIWGDSPSLTAEHALEIFRNAGVQKILVPGSGYGRNTRLFSASGFDVTGVEISAAAYAMSLAFDKLSRFYKMSALNMVLIEGSYDAVYCFNVLHLFREKERQLFIQQCAGKIQGGGMMYFTVFSEEESSFGKGQETETNTFESKPGRPVHYFTESDLAAHFENMKILETGIKEDPEEHGSEGPHTHRLRYICVKI
jgi:SAM-dependent methyltransferase